MKYEAVHKFTLLFHGASSDVYWVMSPFTQSKGLQTTCGLCDGNIEDIV